MEYDYDILKDILPRKETREEQNRRHIQELTLMDDEFLTKVFEDNIPCTELVLSIIIEKDLHVKSVKTQYGIKNLQGRSVRLDIYAEDDEGKKYNIEIQKSDKGAAVKRARYNSSLIDANVLDVGEDFENLPETYVIFITEHDVLKGGKAIYHVDKYIRELDYAEFDDKSHIVYVNAQIKDDTSALGKLMHDFECAKAEEMNYPVLADRVRGFKEDEEGEIGMSGTMERFRQEIIEETKAEDKILNALEHIKNVMASLNTTITKAMEILCIPESDYAMYEELVRRSEAASSK